jgi:hypothetical protein
MRNQILVLLLLQQGSQNSHKIRAAGMDFVEKQFKVGTWSYLVGPVHLNGLLMVMVNSGRYWSWS